MMIEGGNRMPNLPPAAMVPEASLSEPYAQIDWALLDRSDNGKTLTRKTACVLEGPNFVRWMTAAVLEAEGRPVGLGMLEAKLVINPFGLGDNLGFVLFSESDLELSADSSGNQFVAL
ncbi:hypothetical protein LCL97_22880 [Seohaeicola saemankumensis]|nr:hypothetical protein [Seohaeicola saemankumensis]MCA0873688.1 hypothetical protein [Seohaeicola saemankumensis]